PAPTTPCSCWTANVKPYAATHHPSPRHPRGHRRRRELPATPRNPPPRGIPPAVFHPPPVARIPLSGRPFRYRPAPTPHTRPSAPPGPHTPDRKPQHTPGRRPPGPPAGTHPPALPPAGPRRPPGTPAPPTSSPPTPPRHP